MARFLAAKKLRGLYPVDDEGEAVLRSIGQGELMACEIKRERNIQFHRKFFCMLSIILANQEYYRSMDDLLDVAKLSVGHYRTIETAKHGQVKIPSSISFAAMDAVAFQEFYDKVVAWVRQDVIPGLKRRDLDDEVEAALLGFGD